jgi:hypothetical protein
MDDGSRLIALFIYVRAKPDPVVVQLTGCRFVTNNRLPTSYRASSSLVKHLQDTL